MRRAAMWLLLIMIASYSIAYAAVKDMQISWNDESGIIINDGVLLFSDGDRTDLNESGTAQLEGVKKIEVKGISSDIRIVKDSREDAHASLVGYYVASGSYIPPKLVINQSGNTLFIEVEHTKQLTSFNKVSLDLTVTLPESYAAEIEIDGVSSDVNVDFGSYESVSIHTVSGDVKLDSVDTESVRVGTTSGEVDLESGRGKAQVDTVSGDVDLQFAELTGNVDVQTTSGEVKLMIPDSEGFKVDFKSTSGELRSTKELGDLTSEKRKLRGVYGSGMFDIEASTVSGDITLR